MYHTFNECVEFLVFDVVALHVDLQRQQQCEEKLVLFVQTTCSVLIHLKGHELYDAGDPFACDGGFRRSVQIDFDGMTSLEFCQFSAPGTVLCHCNSNTGHHVNFQSQMETKDPGLVEA